MNTIDLETRPRGRDGGRDVRTPSGRRRAPVAGALVSLVVAVAVTAVALRGLGAPASTPPPPPSAAPIPATWTLDPYRALATWVDVFDYTPARQAPGMRPPVAADEIDVMAIRGVRTVFLQAATRPAADDDRALADLLGRAHDVGLDAVVWYVPALDDVDADAARLAALRRFEAAGERFDGMALALWPAAVAGEATEGERRLLELSRRVHALTAGDPIGAVLPAVDASSERALPLRELGASYDVWLPLTFWSVSAAAPTSVVADNLAALRAALAGDVPVHVVGGVGDEVHDRDYAHFATAVREGGPIGASIYDYTTTSAAGWAVLEHELGEASWGTAGLRE